jgi:hypothetical protein
MCSASRNHIACTDSNRESAGSMSISIGRPLELQSSPSSACSTPKVRRIGDRSSNCSSLRCEVAAEQEFESRRSGRWPCTWQCADPWRLTVELRGRAQTHPARSERKIAKRARGAPPQEHHGPLERLLDAQSSEDVMATAAAEGVADSWRRIHGQADHMPLCLLRTALTY